MMYISGNQYRLPTDDDRILMILSRLKTGTAATWAEVYYQSNLINNVLVIQDTLLEFLEKLDAAFEDPNAVEKALRDFRTLTQGRLTAADFFSKFDIALGRAKLTHPAHNILIIDHLKRALNWNVVREVMHSSPRPTTYAGWKTQAIAMDAVE